MLAGGLGLAAEHAGELLAAPLAVGDLLFGAAIARRRLRIYPPRFGNSTSMYSVPLDDVRGAVEDGARLFLQKLEKFRRVAGLNFKNTRLAFM